MAIAGAPGGPWLAFLRPSKRFATGARWLLGRWQALAAVLEKHGCWVKFEAEFAIRLLGQRPDSDRIKEQVLGWQVHYHHAFARAQPWAWMIDWQIDKPIPVPPCFVL